MKKKKKLKDIDVFFSFNYIINITKINFSNALLDNNLYENISVYNIS